MQALSLSCKQGRADCEASGTDGSFRIAAVVPATGRMGTRQLLIRNNDDDDVARNTIRDTTQRGSSDVAQVSIVEFVYAVCACVRVLSASNLSAAASPLPQPARQRGAAVAVAAAAAGLCPRPYSGVPYDLYRALSFTAAASAAILGAAFSTKSAGMKSKKPEVNMET